MSLVTLNISNIKAMEDTDKGDDVINTNHFQPVAAVMDNNPNLSIINEEEKDTGLRNILNTNDFFNRQALQASIDNIIKNSINELKNSVVYSSNNNKKYNNIISNINKYPTDYKQQKPVELSFIKDKQYNQEYEKFLFSIDDSNIIAANKIKEIQDDINLLIKNNIFENNPVDKIQNFYNVLIHYYNNNADKILNKNACATSEYDASKTYIPFKLLQIMYTIVKKYGEDIAQKVINKVYNSNKDTVHEHFKKIYNKQEFTPEEHKKTRGFLGNYQINKIPSHKELDTLQGKALANYWEYANHNEKIFPSINVHYTEEYLQEAYRRWQNNIQHKLNNIIEESNKNKTIDNIVNYYAIVANRSPNIYLSNDVIDFVHNKLGINDAIYFIDKFINIKQQYMTEDDLPVDVAYFPNAFNEYPNGNLKEYKVNTYNPNCIACIFNSSDQYGDAVGVNRILIDNNKEELYTRLVGANTVFHSPRWQVNKHSKVNHDCNKEYKTLFLYYTK